MLSFGDWDSQEERWHSPSWVVALDSMDWPEEDSVGEVSPFSLTLPPEGGEVPWPFLAAFALDVMEPSNDDDDDDDVPVVDDVKSSFFFD